MKHSNIVTIVVALIYCATIHAQTTLPSLQDPDGAVNNVSGYKNYNWYEFNNWNGSILSPEYVAYIFKHLPIYDGQHDIVRLIGGTPSGSSYFSYVALLYTNNGSCIPGGFFTMPNGYYPAKDLIHSRIRGCQQWGLPSWCGSNYATPISCTNGSSWTTPYSSQNQLQQFLSQHLSSLTQGLIPLARTVAADLIQHNAGGYGNAISFYQNYQTAAFNLNTLPSYSVGDLGLYHNLINQLFTSVPFPASDTSDVMFGKSSTSFSNHAIYLLFAANKYSREYIPANRSYANTLLGIAVLLHRFNVLQERVSSENWQQNPNIADLYELIAIMNAILPGFNDGQGNTLPQLSQWNNAANAGNALENLSSEQLALIGTASSNIKDAMPTEIKDLHEINLCPDGSLYNSYSNNCFYKKLPLINFTTNGKLNTDIQLFNWSAYPSLTSANTQKITAKI